MKKYEEVINKLAEDKYEDRKMGISVNRFEAIKTTALIFELPMKKVHTDVHKVIEDMVESDVPDIDTAPIDYKEHARKVVLKGVGKLAQFMK